MSDQKSPHVVTRKSALLAMLFTSPVFLLCVFLGKVEEGFGVWICAGIVVLSIIVRWDLRKSGWFWLVILIAALLQIPFIAFVPWTNRHMSFVSFLPFGVLDYAMVYGCIKLFEKLIAGNIRAGSGS
jgi:hypothetical protein